jgi:hypothetical protein
MLRINCPSCGRMIQAPETMRGKRVRCPLCSQVFEIAADDALSHEPDVPEAVLDEEESRPRRRRAPHRGAMVLTMGILGLVILPFIFGPLAWVMGSSDLRKMDAGIMDSSGREFTKAGKICGIIGTCLAATCCSFYGFLGVLALLGQH